VTIHCRHGDGRVREGRKDFAARRCNPAQLGHRCVVPRWVLLCCFALLLFCPALRRAPERCPPFPPSPSGMFVSTLVFVRIASKRPRQRTVTVLRPPLPLHEVAVRPAPLLPPTAPPPSQPAMDEAAAALATQPPSSVPSPPPSPQTLGERLYALIQVEQGSLAGKITGMLLDGLDYSELVALIDDQVVLQSKIQEALAVLKEFEYEQTTGNYHHTKEAPMVPTAAQSKRVDLQTALKTAHLSAARSAEALGGAEGAAGGGVPIQGEEGGGAVSASGAGERGVPVRLEAIEISGALTSAAVPLRGGGCTEEGGREAWGRGERRAGYGDSSSCSRSGSSSSSECSRECAPGAENAPPVRQADSESEACAAPRLDHDGAPAARGGGGGQERRAPASLPTWNEKLLGGVASAHARPWYASVPAQAPADGGGGGDCSGGGVSGSGGGSGGGGGGGPPARPPRRDVAMNVLRRVEGQQESHGQTGKRAEGGGGEQQGGGDAVRIKTDKHRGGEKDRQKHRKAKRESRGERLGPLDADGQRGSARERAHGREADCKKGKEGRDKKQRGAHHSP